MCSLNVFLDSSLTWGAQQLPPLNISTKDRASLATNTEFCSFKKGGPGRRNWLGLSSSPYKEGRGKWWENVSSCACCCCSLPGDGEIKDGVRCLVLEGAALPPLPSTTQQPTHQRETKHLCKAAVIRNHGRGEVQMFGIFLFSVCFSKQMPTFPMGKSIISRSELISCAAEV